MNPRLIIESLSGDEPVTITELDEGSITIGREPENNIVVDSEGVSRRHASISQAGSQWVFRDLDTTNGSWVNGVQVFVGQVRVLRDGDFLRLADFPVRILLQEKSEFESEAALDPQNSSLLVFFANKFENEVFLSESGASFIVGGPDGDLQVDGGSSDAVQLTVTNVGGRLELTTGQSDNSIIVNGLAVAGTTALVDGDEIGIGAFQLIVNDRPSATRLQDGLAGFSGPNGDSPAAIVSERDAASAYSAEDWGSESQKRRSHSSRRFIFGSEPSEINPMGTVSLPTEDVASRVGFEPNQSQRIAAALMGEVEEEQSASEQNVVYVGMAVFVVILGIVLYFLFQ